MKPFSNSKFTVFLYRLLIIFLFSFPAGYILNKLKYGKFNLSRQSVIGCIKEIPDPVFGYKSSNLCKENAKVYLDKFISDISPYSKNQDTLDFLIIGGSVAGEISNNSDLDLILSKKFSPKKIRIYNAAVGGGKQPQGLFTYSALISLGYKFDFIIDLSGYNEIGLSIQENYNEYAINPIYPRAANLRQLNYSKTILKSSFLNNLEKILWINPLNQYLAKQNIYKYIRRNLIEKSIRKNSGERLKYNFLMPENEQKAFELSTNIYYKSVQNTYQIAKINDAIYLLVIQPNFYLNGSKIISPEEFKIKERIYYKSPKLIKKIFGTEIKWSGRVGKIIEKYYSKLEINKFDIPLKNISDQRFIFQDNNEPLYIDECCHMNKKGMNIIANEISNNLYFLGKEKI